MMCVVKANSNLQPKVFRKIDLFFFSKFIDHCQKEKNFHTKLAFFADLFFLTVKYCDLGHHFFKFRFTFEEQHEFDRGEFLFNI